MKSLIKKEEVKSDSTNHDNNSWHTKTKEDILKELKTSEKGLSDNEAQLRLKKYGKNEIKKKHKLGSFKIIFEQFKSFLIYILIIAAIISFLIGHILDASIITAIIIINAGIGFFQQYKAEKAISKLKKLIVPTSRVMRNNKLKKIPSYKLVPGDFVVLNSGDKVNADCRIIEADNLQTNEAILTGESLPVEKTDEKTYNINNIPLAERKNMLYAGTQIVRGNCKAIIVSTGMNTEFGKIAHELQEVEIQKTPMQKRLDVFSRQIGLIILGLVILIILLGFLKHFNMFDMFLTAVALAVSAIPEGLPAVLAISFAISSIAMSKENVITRKLPAVESLGSVTIICSDKTGTITEEEMYVQEIFSNNKLYKKSEKNIIINNKKINPKKQKELFQLIKTSLLCNNARFEKVIPKQKQKIGEKGYEFIGDPTEEALVRAGLNLGFNKKDLTEKEPRKKEIQFTSKRKMMSVIRDKGPNKVMYSKGASEKILSLCASELVNGEIKKLTDKRKKQLLETAKKMESDALRVLGFAYKNFPKKSEKFEEKGLIFLGFIGMLDPPRKEVKQAVSNCISAGIEVKIITGDSELTAKKIAEKIGIKGKTITESQLIKMSDRDLLREINEISVFARTTPQQKLRITKLLQTKKQVVAITGDGINDVLALKSADIGIAMGIRGTDVARDVSDIILSDDNFASIVSGIREGRKTYDNIKKFTKYLLAVNFSEIFLISIALVLRLPLPLLPLQILWINLVTDSFPALALIREKQENVMQSKPRQEKSILDGIWKFIIIAGIIAFIAEIVIFLIGMNNNLPIEETRTMVLTTAILFEMFFIYTCRSDKSLFKIGIFSNKWLNYAVIFSILLQIILIYTPLASAFGVVPLTFSDWLFVLPFAISGLIIFEIWKYFKR